MSHDRLPSHFGGVDIINDDRKESGTMIDGNYLCEKAKATEKGRFNPRNVALMTIRLNSDGSGEQIRSYKHDLPMYAASVNKLAIANYWISGQSSPEEYLTVSSEDILKGAGAFDVALAPKEWREKDSENMVLVEHLIADMLMHSGNTAAKVLAKGSLEDINRFLQSSGYVQTKLHLHEDGKFDFGNTTAMEAIMLLTELIGAKGRLAEVAQKALASNGSPFFYRGIETAGLSRRGAVVYNKCGSFNGDSDIQTGVRHEVGGILLPDIGPVMYCIMTDFPLGSRLRGWMAETTVQNIRRMIIAEVDPSSAEIENKLAMLALSLTGD